MTTKKPQPAPNLTTTPKKETTEMKWLLTLLMVFVFCVPAQAQTTPVPPVPTAGDPAVQQQIAALQAQLADVQEQINSALTWRAQLEFFLWNLPPFAQMTAGQQLIFNDLVVALDDNWDVLVLLWYEESQLIGQIAILQNL